MLAVQCGADAIGMIFAPSVRQISPEAAREIARELPAFITPVGVFVDPLTDDIARARAIFPDLVVQLHGNEAPAFVASIDGKVIKTIHIPPEGAQPEEIDERCAAHPRALMLFDTAVAGRSGGTGITFNWRSIAQAARTREVLVAGGLTPDNVSNCVRTVRPFGVDAAGGIETDGRKDPFKMRAFVQAVKETDAA